ncbi:Fructose-like permease IIC component 1 [compost metagenome]
MGLIGVSEGAIPFALANPKIIVVNVLGAAIGASMAVWLGAVNRAPLSGFYGWLAVENVLVYVLSIFTGAAIIAIGSLLVFRGDTQANQPISQEKEKITAPKFKVSR